MLANPISYNFIDAYLKLENGIITDLYLEKDIIGDMRICIKIKYTDPIIEISSYRISYKLDAYVISYNGILELSRKGINKSIKIPLIKIGPSNRLNLQNEIILYSKNLSLREIYDISEMIRGEKIQVKIFNNENYRNIGWIPYAGIYYILRSYESFKPATIKSIPGNFIEIIFYPAIKEIDYTSFVKKFLNLQT